MDALKAGAHKAQEAMNMKKADDKLDTAADPSKKPSERVDAAHDAAKAQSKADEHGMKAECRSGDHACGGHDHKH